MSTPKKATKSTKKASKRATPPKKRQPKIVGTPAPLDPEAERRQAEINKAIAAAGIDLDHVEVFHREAMAHREEPVAFALSGHNTETGEYFVEAFKCYDELPAQTHTHLLIMTDGERGIGVQTEALTAVVREAVIEEQRPRYDALTRDPKRLVDVFQIAAAGSYLSAQYTGRPTEPSTD